jgi:hypothetical protein
MTILHPLSPRSAVSNGPSGTFHTQSCMGPPSSGQNRGAGTGKGHGARLSRRRCVGEYVLEHRDIERVILVELLLELRGRSRSSFPSVPVLYFVNQISFAFLGLFVLLFNSRMLGVWMGRNERRGCLLPCNEEIKNFWKYAILIFSAERGGPSVATRRFAARQDSL